MDIHPYSIDVSPCVRYTLPQYDVDGNIVRAVRDRNKPSRMKQAAEDPIYKLGGAPLQPSRTVADVLNDPAINDLISELLRKSIGA
jgi:hypothetical protein